MTATKATRAGHADGRGATDESVARQLLRGLLGLALIGAGIALTPSLGPAALLICALGLVPLRGCPTCWAVSLIGSVSQGRLERSCRDGACTLVRPGER
ncbi:hypothetical protein ABZ721_18320 [Streptomyces sp. NPDC006733]|uniref:hypothetical protein n=1 Tax=Streptomyces sp. NPDC006733 TaxID=3155460 RepID=UPI0033D50E07